MNNDLGDHICNSFIFKTKNEITIKQHFLLFSDGEPYIDNAQSYQVHTYQADQKAWVNLHRAEADVTSLIDNGVTNLSGKTLSKWIHCSLDILTKLM